MYVECFMYCGQLVTLFLYFHADQAFLLAATAWEVEHTVSGKGTTYC